MRYTETRLTNSNEWVGTPNNSTSVKKINGKVVSTNYALNPDMELTTGQMEITRNYHLNPSAGYTLNSSWGGFTGSGNVDTWSNVTSTWSPSNVSKRKTCTSVQNNTLGNINIQYGTSVSLMNLDGETPITVSFSWCCSREGVTMGTPVIYPAANHTGATPRSRNTNIITEAGKVYNDFITFTPVSGELPTEQQIYINTRGHQTGDYFEMSMGDIYIGPYQPDRKWFSGSYSPDPDLIPSWTGTANASQSVLKANKVSLISGNGGEPVKGYTIGSKTTPSGETSVRLYKPSNGSTDSFIQLTNDNYPVLTPGAYIGVLATIYIPTSLTGTHATGTRLQSVMMHFYGASVDRLFGKFPNTEGTYIVSGVQQIPANTTGGMLRIYSGWSFGDLHLGNILVVSGDTPEQVQAQLDLGYFSGDTPKLLEGKYTYYEDNGVSVMNNHGVISKNLHKNPGAIGTNLQYYGKYQEGGTASIQLIDTPYSTSGRASRVKAETNCTRMTTQAKFDIDTVTIGTIYTVSFKWVSNITNNHLIEGPLMYAVSNVPYIQRSRGSSVITPNVVTQEYITFVAIEGQRDNLRMSIAINNLLAGDYIDLFDVDIYEGPYNPDREWFYGDSYPKSI